MTIVKENCSAIREVLCKAADWLEKHEWCQHFTARPSMSNPEEACLFGSVMIAAGGYSCDDDLFDACRRRLRSGGYSATWNDQPLRTKEQVVKALRCTADKCKGDTDEQVDHSG